MKENRLVSIVLPVYNQAEHIGGVVGGFEDALSSLPIPHEFILVVNNCRDNSLEVCRALAEKHSTVRMTESESGGWGRAVRSGLQAAQGDILCYTNSARTAPADLIILVLYALANPGSVIKGHRHSRESFQRKAGSFLFNLQCRGLFSLPTWDINATPKVFSREVYQALDLKSDGDLLDLELYLQCHRLNKTILEVPLYSRSRHSGSSTTNYRSAWRLYRGAFLMWKASRSGRS